MLSTATSTAGAGVKSRRRNGSATVSSNHGAEVSETAVGRGIPAHLRAASRCRTSAAASGAGASPSSRRSSAAVQLNGGLATTLNGARKQTSARSASSTVTPGAAANRARSLRARFGSRSTATTVAPAATSALVIRPVPAPRS